jgi:hypothetical protein
VTNSATATLRRLLRRKVARSELPERTFKSLSFRGYITAHGNHIQLTPAGRTFAYLNELSDEDLLAECERRGLIE